MPRRCTVCDHPKREEIDCALVAGESDRSLAARYGPLSRTSIQRHGASHLPAALVQAHDAAEVAHADTLLDDARAAHAFVAACKTVRRLQGFALRGWWRGFSALAPVLRQ